MSGDVSFLFRPVEEGEGEDGDGCCAPGAHESVCRGVLILTMGPSRSFGSRDEAWLLERTGNFLTSAWSAHLDSDQNRPGRSGGSMSISFLAMIMDH